MACPHMRKAIARTLDAATRTPNQSGPPGTGGGPGWLKIEIPPDAGKEAIAETVDMLRRFNARSDLLSTLTLWVPPGFAEGIERDIISHKPAEQDRLITKAERARVARERAANLSALFQRPVVETPDSEYTPSEPVILTDEERALIERMRQSASAAVRAQLTTTPSATPEPDTKTSRRREKPDATEASIERVIELMGAGAIGGKHNA